ncbi:MAG: flagellar biosynthetic protein FliQ [Candidatus Melainabacteria bacterium]|nr:flagellar biosynthetic protein FliQ [Candidatus Melainabacteria bacterium]
MDWMPQAIREGIFTILFISGPLVVLAAGLGLTIGVIQAATQVQEQTLGSAVKIIGLFLALIIFGFYMFQYMSNYDSQTLERAFKLVPTLGTKAMPRRNFLDVPNGEVEEPIHTAELNEAEPHESHGGHHKAGALDEPDHVTKNENLKPVAIKPPQSALRPNKDIEAIKKQDLTIKHADHHHSQPKVQKPRAESIRPAAKPKTNTQQPSLRAQQSNPVTSSPKPSTGLPRRVAPRNDEGPKKPPKRLRRSSVSDRLNKLKGLGR